jgi:hypothetical protein
LKETDRFTMLLIVISRFAALVPLLLTTTIVADSWRCHIIDPDPRDHGPDGATIRDFDQDGLPDLLVPFEQGDYSRLYFHPGYQFAQNQSRWTYIEFPFGGEDNGAGDLDQDGHIDLVINGGHIFFNPGPQHAREAEAWQQMTLFTKQARVPVVRDIDGDSHSDLLVNGTHLYRAPTKGKRIKENWMLHRLGETTWPMNALFHDINRDGNDDIVVADRNGLGTVWFEAPTNNRLAPWPFKVIDPRTNISFMKIADIDHDGKEDLVLTTKDTKSITILRRTSHTSSPQFEEFTIPQAAGDFPKGVNVFDYDEDGKQEIFALPKGRGEWIAEVRSEGSAMTFDTKALSIPGLSSRLKMDDAIHEDMDGDGDMDIVTTDENGGWGVIWFENPLRHLTDIETKPDPQGAYHVTELIHEDDFEVNASAWAVEQMEGGTTDVHYGVMEIEDAKGCTVWFRHRMSAPVLIEFDVKMIQGKGPFDRVSDLNSFTMAIDPENPDDILANGANRGGSFKNYHSLKLYYVGYGANNNKTARFRRYVGDGTRPVLPEHDLQRSHLPNQWRRVQILSTEGNYQYWIDGELVFDIHDPQPHTSGWFGFRTVRNHMMIDRFRVWRVEKSAPKN